MLEVLPTSAAATTGSDGDGAGGGSVARGNGVDSTGRLRLVPVADPHPAAPPAAPAVRS